MLQITALKRQNVFRNATVVKSMPKLQPTVFRKLNMITGSLFFRLVSFKNILEDRPISVVTPLFCFMSHESTAFKQQMCFSLWTCFDLLFLVLQNKNIAAEKRIT